MKVISLIFLLIANFAVWGSDLTDILSVDVPPAVYNGGAASVNWVLVIVSLLLLSATIFLFRVYVLTLREQLTDMSKFTLMLKEATEVINENNEARKSLITLMESVREVMRSCRG